MQENNTEMEEGNIRQITITNHLIMGIMIRILIKTTSMECPREVTIKNLCLINNREIMQHLLTILVNKDGLEMIEKTIIKM